MSTEDMSELASTIWVEYFNEGDIDQIYPLRDLTNIDFINERIQTHTNIEDGQQLKLAANDVQRLLSIRVKLLLKNFDLNKELKSYVLEDDTDNDECNHNWIMFTADQDICKQCSATRFGE